MVVGGRKWAQNSKCSYTGWAWCRIHLRDERIRARDVIFPTAYNLHLQPSRKTSSPPSPDRRLHLKLRRSSGCIDKECCILVRDSQGKKSPRWETICYPRRSVNFRLHGVTCKKTVLCDVLHYDVKSSV